MADLDKTEWICTPMFGADGERFLGFDPKEELVRCKDCKYAFTGNWFYGLACMKYPKNNSDITTVKDDHFCAYGKRSSDDSD